ncbi:MAG: tetratricopeptide repeat protein [Caldithrix sp.]|nr:MAG: tetratricopeptide repeat protein [Caldithrix sp.]
MRKMILFLILNVFFVISAFAQGGHKQVTAGNKLYAEEKYDEANNKYRDALVENPESSIINFNIGDVQYKKRHFEEAIKSYEKSTSSDEIKVQSGSYYNIGNTLYKMGKLPESISAYKKALELNPEDEDAKYNLEYVRAKLKDKSEKQPQENQQQQQEEQNQDKEQNSEEQKEEQQEQQQNNQENQENPEEQQEQQQEQATEPKEISKEDAERLLNALQNEEKDLLKEQKPKRRGRPFRGKDW